MTNVKRLIGIEALEYSKTLVALAKEIVTDKNKESQEEIKAKLSQLLDEFIDSVLAIAKTEEHSQ